MGDGTGTKNGCEINMGDWNGTKDGYKNDIENGVSKYRKNIILIIINIILFNYLIILINNFIYLIILFILLKKTAII